jgi:hypothetical protein
MALAVGGSVLRRAVAGDMGRKKEAWKEYGASARFSQFRPMHARAGRLRGRRLGRWEGSESIL